MERNTKNTEELKSCVTCRFVMQKCSGDCDSCERAIVRAVDDIACKCHECRDDENGIYKYYEADEELLSLIKEEEK